MAEQQILGNCQGFHCNCCLGRAKEAAQKAINIKQAITWCVEPYKAKDCENFVVCFVNLRRDNSFDRKFKMTTWDIQKSFQTLFLSVVPLIHATWSLIDEIWPSSQKNILFYDFKALFHESENYEHFLFSIHVWGITFSRKKRFTELRTNFPKKSNFKDQSRK